MSIDKILFLFIALSISFLAYSEDGANQDTTRALIVARLLSQISWQEQDFVQKSNQTFKLCSYKSYPAYRNFTNNLKKLSINNLPITTDNIVDQRDVSSCHAIYLNAAVLGELAWFLSNNQSNKVILVVEGSFLSASKGSKGGHINLSLNTQGYFDFEINPDMFIQSKHSPSLGLLKLGKMLTSQTADEINLMRNLINYTTWPDNGESINSAEFFQLCASMDSPLINFAEYFLSSRVLKGKKVVINRLSTEDDVSLCHAFFLGKTEVEKALPLMLARKQSNTLLIGNYVGFGEYGAHYNLQPGNMSNGRRFEINLFAFKLTGHQPKYELLNSAIVIERDFPSLASELTRIAQLTEWPASVASKIKKPVNLCIVQEEELVSGLLPFLVKHFSKVKILSSSQLEGKGAIVSPRCDSLFVAGPLKEVMNHFVKKQNYQEVLLVTSRTKKSADEPFNQLQHYSLLLSPNAILLELNLQNMRNTGFSAKTELMQSATVVGGASQ